MPINLRDECLGLAKICLGVSIFLAVAMLVLGVSDEMDCLQIVGNVRITPMAGLVVWIYLGCGSKFITWLKWKKWAKGQGWEE